VEAIILAGGLGTRLKSRLNGIPKPMALIAGRPFLEYLMDRLVMAGFQHTIISVGYLGESIASHYGYSYRGMPLTYVEEAAPLGTGGAIRKSLKAAHDSSTVVMNGDTYSETDYHAMFRLHRDSNAILTIAVTSVDDMTRYGGVILKQGKIDGFIEKGRSGHGWINAGTYIISQRFPWPSHLPARFSFETEILMPLMPQLDHTVFMNSGKFIDIGIPEDLDHAQEIIGSCC
jgi:D-glycero-alpha-D-manno-heptose 1-phosphate guanylyltransferase